MVLPRLHVAQLHMAGCRSHDPLIGIGDDKLYAPEPALRQLAQEGRPDGFNLRRDDLEPQNLASAVTVGAGCGDDGDGAHPPTAPDLQIGGIVPEIRPVNLDGPLKEGLQLIVDRAGRNPLKANLRGSSAEADLALWARPRLSIPVARVMILSSVRDLKPRLAIGRARARMTRFQPSMATA